MPNDDKKVTTDTPPIIFAEDAVPPMLQQTPSPVVNAVTTPIGQDITIPTPVGVGSAAPANDIVTDTVMPSVVTSSPKKKYAGGKVIATILGLFLLVGGVGAGVYLTGQNQNISEKASANQCYDDGIAGHIPKCIDPGVCVDSSGAPTHVTGCNYTGPGGTGATRWCKDNTISCGNCTAANPTAIECTNLVELRIVGQGECGQPEMNQNCPPGTIKTNVVESRYCGRTTPNCGPGSAQSLGECCEWGGKDDVSGEKICNKYWIIKYTCVAPKASCQNIKVYAKPSPNQFVLIPNADLPKIKADQVVSFCVTGSTNIESFDRARFTINGVQRPVTTIKRTGTDDYCDNYRIKPEDITRPKFEVSAELHHVTLGWK